MRAIYSRGQSIDDTFVVDDDRATHLIKACRLKKDEEVLILDGKGSVFTSIASQISKRSLTLEVKDSQVSKKNYQIDLLLGLAKRESFELSVKNAVEIGVGQIYPFECEFQTWKIKNKERLESIVESSMIQSNNPFKTIVSESVSGEDIEEIVDNYDHIVLATLNNKSETILSLDKSKKYLLVIGPEGGLSSEEESFLLGLKNSLAINVPTNILRAPNAVSVLCGYLHGKFDAS